MNSQGILKKRRVLYPPLGDQDELEGYVGCAMICVSEMCVCVCGEGLVASSPGPIFIFKLIKIGWKIGPGVHWQHPSTHMLAITKKLGRYTVEIEKSTDDLYTMPITTVWTRKS